MPRNEYAVPLRSSIIVQPSDSTDLGAAITPKSLGFGEFVAMVAALMSLGAVAIDLMLPGLPQIARSLHVADPNGQQWIVTAYLIGMGGGQLLYGPLADMLGRRQILLTGIVIYIAFSLVAGESSSLPMMLAARSMQGVGAAASRVLAVSIVRDCYSGRQMARVMSFSIIVFLTVPVLAPSIGQLALLLAPWPWLFRGFAIYAGVIGLWVWWRLPETLHPEDRSSIAPRHVFQVFWIVLTDRLAIGYTLAMTVVFGSFFGFIACAQQIFADVFDQAALFPLIFALAAASMAISSLMNSRIVGRLGSRVVSHTALLGFIVVAAVHAAIAVLGFETIWTFAILQSLIMFCSGSMGPNFGSMAMESVGHIAGTASSVQGFLSTLGGAIIGTLVGGAFNGSVIPLTTGFLLSGLGALAIVFVTEKGRLFQPHNPAV